MPDDEFYKDLKPVDVHGDFWCVVWDRLEDTSDDDRPEQEPGEESPEAS